MGGIKENVSLQEYTTFRVGGKAQYFFEAKKESELVEAIKLAKEKNLPFFILGQGSNLLVSDKGFNGLVIKIKSQTPSFLKKEGENPLFLLEDEKEGAKFKIFSGAGVPLSRLVLTSLEIGATGLEWAAGLPGTVGGAIYGNAGAFGHSIADVVKTVRVLEILCSEIQNAKFKMQNDNVKFKIKEYKNKECKFGYRDSIFKQRKNLIILSAQFQLKKGEKKEIKKRMEEYLNYRKNNQPLGFFSAGSVFRNYQGKIKDRNLVKEFPEIKEFNKKGIIPAGYLIDRAGLKGKKIGGAMVSFKHANFIVNYNKAKAEDIKALVELIKNEVKKKFGVQLEEEIQYLGF